MSRGDMMLSTDKGLGGRGSSPTATSLSSKSRSEATTDRTQAYTCADGDRFAKSKIPSYAFRLIKGLFLRA
ncbi:hypothetical protein U1Q18_031516 [Sarracenia purpurea var. burkii]